MLAQALQTVTRPNLVLTPKCATCSDQGFINDPFSLGDTLPCECRDGQFNTQAFRDSVAELFFQTVMTPTVPGIRGVMFPDFCGDD